MSGITIPSLILKQLYTFGSLENNENGAHFSIKNRLSDAKVTQIHFIKIDGDEIDKANILIDAGDDGRFSLVDSPAVIDLPLGKVLQMYVEGADLKTGKHEIEFSFEAEPFGTLRFTVEDTITDEAESLQRIPRDSRDDYNPQIIADRQRFAEDFADTKLQHIRHYSLDPQSLQGNIEHFSGVAQIPLGFAGPIRINGEHAQGDFVIPLATTEGTLVASYNRGIKVINLSGGVKCSVVGDAMQRAPVFVFSDARGARDFLKWVDENIEQIRYEAEATSNVAKLQYIDPFLANKFAYLRFNFSTGDAAGQNMVGRATFAACSWILDHYTGIEHFYLESNFATDKKASQVNIMRTRGKRVTAEITIPRDILIHHMRVEPEDLYYHQKVSQVGAILSGANNNGAHSPNAITAMFIATGQDVANVSESSAGIVYVEMTPERDIYISMTIPSLIVATYGGGTGLATQRECLEILGCYGKGKVHKLAEIIAGVVMAGEISLASAISSSDWVSSHEKYGRNR